MLLYFYFANICLLFVDLSGLKVQLYPFVAKSGCSDYFYGKIYEKRYITDPGFIELLGTIRAF